MKKVARFLAAMTVVAFATLIGLAVYELNQENQSLALKFTEIKKKQGEFTAESPEQKETAELVRNIESGIAEENHRRLLEAMSGLDELVENQDHLRAEMEKLEASRQATHNTLDAEIRELRDLVLIVSQDMVAIEYRDDPTRAIDDLAPLVHINMMVEKVTANITGSGPVALSGFIIRWEGEAIIITAGHFLPENGSVYNINCFFADGSPATVLEFVGLSHTFDFAVFKFKKGYEYNRRCFSLGTSSALARLSPVISLGSPLVFSHGVHFLSGYGHVMSPNFHSNYSGAQPSVILHLAITNSGNSGGPLLDSEGRVVGITVGVIEKRNVSIDTRRGEMSLKLETNMYTATPIDDVKRALPKILKKGRVRHGQLRGLQIEASSLLSEKDFKKLGIPQPAENVILVVSVGKKTAAEEAGFLPGDIILSVNDSFITHPNDFARELAHREADEGVVIIVDRKGVTIKLPVTLEAFAPSLPPVIVK